MIVALGLAGLLLLRRHRPPASLRTAYAAVSTLRDRLAQAAAGGPPAADLDPLVDDADRTLRMAQAEDLSELERSAVEGAIAAVAQTRDALGSGRGAHAREADVESAIGRALAALDGALLPLRSAAGAPGPADPTGGSTSG